VPRVVKLQKEPLARRAVYSIRDAIFAGEYSPGERMVEEDLAQKLGVSRNVVREAFWQLEAQGLIQSDDYKGKSVAALSPEAMLELMPLRVLMESLAAMWAAAKITPQGKEALTRQVARFTEELPAYSSYAEIDFELHQMIWRLAENRRVAQMLDRIAGPMIALQAKVYQPLLAEVVRKEVEGREGSHRRLVDEICAGNPSKARVAMQKHLAGFWQMWLKQQTASQVNGRDSHEAIHDAVSLLESLSTVLTSIPKGERRE
jgi:DNA-binding GntR family transcriptional regulator